MGLSGISPEVAAAYLAEQAERQAERKWNLDLPDDAERTERGFVNWNEVAIIVDMFKKVEPEKDREVYIVKFKIIGEDTKNLGRVTSNRMYYATYEPLAENHEQMNAITEKNILQLALGAGLDISKGLTDSVLDVFFPTKASGKKSSLLGTTWYLGLSDNVNKKYNNENTQNITSMIRLATPDVEDDDEETDDDE